MKHRGFQRNFINDVYHIEERLQKEVDEHLYITFNLDTGEHLIMDGMMDIAVMRLPQKGFESLDARIIERFKQIRVGGEFSASEVVDESDRKREADNAKRAEDMGEDFAKEAKDAFINAYDYGITSGTKKYVQVSK